ncbi:MAG: HAMP domain-containing protein [Firmicutes bacterium]|nr:HAMP domain-containing protein [Candidatus Fermentithermobacillaceae bacterium]
MRMKTRILLVFIVVIALMVALSLVSSRQISAVTAVIQEEFAAARLMTLHAHQLYRVVAAQRLTATCYFYTGDQAYLDQFMTGSREAERLLEMVVSESAGKPSEKAAKDIQEAWAKYKSCVEQARSLMEAGDRDAALQYMLSSGKDSEAMLDWAVSEFSRLADAGAVDAASRATVRARETQRVLEIATAVATCVVLIAAVLNANGIARRLGQLASVMQVMAGGDLSVKIPEARGKDEISTAFGALESMRLQLKELINQVAELAEQVAASSQELSATSDEASRAVAQITAELQVVANSSEEQAAYARDTGSTASQLRTAVTELAMGAENEARSVQETLEFVRQLDSAVQRVASSVSSLFDASNGMQEAAASGDETVQKTMMGMEKIVAVTDKIGQHLMSLASHSERIGQIVGLISDIAEQTNLLALNAAIEAARAGEHGRGFAVVADEVRKLSEQSAVSAKEIASLIKSIQTSIEGAVNSMSEGKAVVADGMSLAGDTRNALTRIIQAISITNEEIHRVSGAIQEIANVSTQVSKRMDEVASVIEETTAASEQMASSSASVQEAAEKGVAKAQEIATAIGKISASSQEIASSSQEIAKAAQNLAQMAQELVSQISRFREG